jgi:hypothetical protein
MLMIHLFLLLLQRCDIGDVGLAQRELLMQTFNFAIRRILIGYGLLEVVDLWR